MRPQIPVVFYSSLDAPPRLSSTAASALATEASTAATSQTPPTAPPHYPTYAEYLTLPIALHPSTILLRAPPLPTSHPTAPPVAAYLTCLRAFHQTQVLRKALRRLLATLLHQNGLLEWIEAGYVVEGLTRERCEGNVAWAERAVRAVWLEVRMGEEVFQREWRRWKWSEERARRWGEGGSVG